MPPSERKNRRENQNMHADTFANAALVTICPIVGIGLQ